MDPVPQPGQWPVDPQEDVPISKDRIWIDGCFDFAHHGHAGAMLQARQLGKELYVGVHSDEDILENKGPCVMTLTERAAAVEACRWSTKCVPNAPYVTSLPWISHYGCYFVVHGDDVTSDADGQDCYRYVKAAGRFMVVKRTPGISTTDLVGRMLLCTKTHFIKSLAQVLTGKEGSGSEEERTRTGQDMMKRITDYATDETGLNPACEVWTWEPTHARPERKSSQTTGDRRYSGKRRSSQTHGYGTREGKGTWRQLVDGKPPRPGQQIVYVDGAFDLFSSGHIEFLRCVAQAETESAAARGWYDEAAKQQRIDQHGEDYGPAYIVAGIHSDEVINYWKGVNYPIMNIYERGLCVLQCKYIHAVIFSAPFIPSAPFLQSFPYGGVPSSVYHGPTSLVDVNYDPYADAKSLGIFREISSHDFAHLNADEIVKRILKSKELYVTRQQAKAAKGLGEEAVRRREIEEAEQQERRRMRKMSEVEKQFGI